jgi:predicted RNA-binding Zn-ribbon protein involved in translation (DUF1610 family)
MLSRSKSPPRIEASKSLNIDPQVSHRHFPCKQCGAALAYSAAATTLVCPYCGTENRIPESTESIEELDFRETLARLADEEPVQSAQITHCDHCGAEVAFDEHVHSGKCPFCGSPVVTTPSRQRHIQPRSLLPFSVSRKDARTAFRGWLKGLWFAPSSLTRHARSETKLAGVYVPYWTYDCETATTYHGQRGEAYQVPQTYSTIEKGRRVIRTRLVTRIRWTPVSGRVLRNFDDILVIASRSLPRQITERLEPWDLDNLVPYREEYLSGFRSEMYQIDLSKGFEQAREIMAGIINDDIARDIGGDFQKISSADTRFGDIRFKHLLLPVWLATFRFHRKSYRFVVNGRTGRVQGERPWSILKLTFAIGAVLVLGLMLIFLMSYYGQIQGP